MAQRLTRMVEPWFEEAWGAVLDESVVWEISTMMHPTQGTVLYAAALCPGVILGTVLSTGLVIPAPSSLTLERVKEYVRGMNEQLSLQATEQLRSGIAEGPLTMAVPKG